MVSKWSQNPYVLGCWTDPVIGTDSSVFANMAGRVKTCSSLVRLPMLIGMASYREVTTVDWSGRMTLLVVFKAGSANLLSPSQAYQ